MGRLFGDSFTVFGPEGLETAVDGWQGRNAMDESQTLRVRLAGIEWKTDRESRKWEKMVEE